MNSSRSTPSLVGACDSSYHQSRATHAWIISTGDESGKTIFGSGPVDGLSPYLSSGRGEPHGLNAIFIMAHLLNVYHACNSKIKWNVTIKA